MTALWQPLPFGSMVVLAILTCCIYEAYGTQAPFMQALSTGPMVPLLGPKSYSCTVLASWHHFAYGLLQYGTGTFLADLQKLHRFLVACI